jgi:WD40 repeat protein
MVDAFVSYSRRDSEFADRLSAALDARRKQAWLDVERIADAEVFPEAIRRAIESAEAFLFVITPDAVTSSFCEQEVAYAAALGKRIVPVLLRPTPDDLIPNEIRERNWITFTEEAEFDHSIDRVVQALDTDLDYRREHTRWLIKALEWDREDHNRSFLLRGAELTAAESWLARSSPLTDPAPTGLQRQYLLTSRQVNTRRQRRVVSASLIVAAVAIGLLALALIARSQANTASAVANSRALAAESENDLAIDPETSVLLAIHAVRQSPTPDALFALREALDRTPLRLALPDVSTATCQNANVIATNGTSAIYNPKGQQIAEGSCSGEVRALNASTGHIEWQRHPSSQVSTIAYSPTGHTLAVGTLSGIELLNPVTGSVRKTFRSPEPTGLAFSPSGPQLVETTASGVVLWDLASDSARNLSFLLNPEYDSPSFTRSGTLIVPSFALGATAVGVAGLSSVPANPPINSVCNNDGASQDGVAVSPSGSYVVCSEYAQDGSARIVVWSTSTWTQEYTLTTRAGTSPAAVAVSPDGSLIAAGFYDGSAGVWSASTHGEVVPILGGTAPVNSLSFSPDGHRLLAAFGDGSARVYDATGSELRSFQVAPSLNVAPIVLTGHKLIALIQQGNTRETFSIGSCASPGCVIRTWPTQGSLAPRDITLSEDPNQLAWMSPDGALAAVWDQTFVSNRGAFQQTTTSIWDVNERRVIRTLPKLPVDSVGFSPDHRLAAVSLYDGGMRIFDLSTGHQVVTGASTTSCRGPGWGIPVVSRDNRMVADADGCGYVYVWDTETGKRVLLLAGINATAVAFNPTGDRLAFASNDDTATVLDIKSRRRVLELIGHTRTINDVGYSRDGSRIATVSVDGTARIWDAQTGRLLRVNSDPEAYFQATEPGLPAANSSNDITRNAAGLNTLTFSPDGRQLATENAAGIVRVWDTCSECGDAGGLLALAAHYVVAPLTPIERFEASAGAVSSFPTGSPTEFNGEGSLSAGAVLGVGAQDITKQSRQDGHLTPSAGALVNQIAIGSPAQIAGIQVGDVIVAFNGQNVGSVLDLIDDIAATATGQNVPLTIYRGQTRLILTATLASTTSIGTSP